MNVMKKKDERFDDCGIDFKAFKVSENNVKVCCEIVKERFKADAERLGIKAMIPKIEARAVVDEDFGKVRLYFHEKVLDSSAKAIEGAYELQFVEYGVNHPIDKDWIEMCNGFTHIIWQNAECNEVKSALIFIRASIYEKNKKKFYAVLEHEVTHALFPHVVFKENALRGDYEND